MTGSKSGFVAHLEKTSVIMIQSHCTNHRPALACGDTNDCVKYIQVVEVTLKQVWKWLEYLKPSAAFVKVCKTTRELDIEAGENLNKKLSVKWRKHAEQGSFQQTKVCQPRFGPTTSDFQAV